MTDESEDGIVYVIIYMSKTYSDVLGVYSTPEKSMDAYAFFRSKVDIPMAATLAVIPKKIDELLHGQNSGSQNRTDSSSL